MNVSVIIVAAGRGTRLGAELPKQYLPLGSGVILMHTIDAFVNSCSQIIVVVPKNGVQDWQRICQQYNYQTPHEVVEGAEERFFSVANGLKVVAKDCDVVLVHDGVRPFVNSELIERVITGAVESGAVVPATAVTDTLRKIGGGIVSRSEVMAVQTPQGFLQDIIKKAYEQKYTKQFTDDGSVVEAAGYSVEMVEGDVENFKITTAYDYKLAQFIIFNS